MIARQPFTAAQTASCGLRVRRAAAPASKSAVLAPGSDFHIEEARTAADGTQLFAVYRRRRNQEETDR